MSNLNIHLDDLDAVAALLDTIAECDMVDAGPGDQDPDAWDDARNAIRSARVKLLEAVDRLDLPRYNDPFG